MCWQIDYVIASLYCENEPDLSHLHYIGSMYGCMIYKTTDMNSPEIKYNPMTRMLIFKGSIGYLYQGHNFTFDLDKFVEAVNLLNRNLGVNLWAATVKEFEFGAIVEVELPPKEYIRAHPDGNKLKTRDNPRYNGYYREYYNAEIVLKLYDVLHRMKQVAKKPKREEIALTFGVNFNKHYLKIEVHYRRPNKTLNNGSDLFLADLANLERIQQFKENLLEQYKKLNPMQNIIIPTGKKDLNAGQIILLELVQYYINSGLPYTIIKKHLYERINSYPEEVLSSADKNARKRTLKAWINKLAFEANTSFDLSRQLEESLNIKKEAIWPLKSIK